MLSLITLVTGCAGDKAIKKRQSLTARQRGERFLGAGDTTRALQQYLKALELNPDDPYLHYDLALVYRQKGIPDKAEFHIKEAIRLKPDYSEAHDFLGVIYRDTGRLDLAIGSHEKALSNELYLYPESAHFNLGVVYLRRKEYRKAVDQFEEAIRLVPDYVEAYVNLGRTYEGLNMYRQARRSYEKAVELVPNSPQTNFYLGKLLVITGEKRAAAESFKEVVRLAPDSDLAREAQRYLKALR
jgi:tetratricopeptide (TPR) repeat protein